MYIREKKLLFIHIPKCAGSSIEKSILAACSMEELSSEEVLLSKNKNPFKGPPSLGHLKASDYVKRGYLTDEDWDGAFKFTFVRNPLARLVSAYNYRGVSWRARLFGCKEWTFHEFVLKYFPRWFEENHLKGHDNWTHVQPMWKMLYDDKGEKLLVDQVGKLENLLEDFAKVCKLANLPEDTHLVHENPSLYRNPQTGKLMAKGEKIHWSEYYDEDTLAFAKSYYAKDFDLFGYDSDLPR
jgi:hypothetical protein